MEDRMWRLQESEVFKLGDLPDGAQVENTTKHGRQLVPLHKLALKKHEV